MQFGLNENSTIPEWNRWRRSNWMDAKSNMKCDTFVEIFFLQFLDVVTLNHCLRKNMRTRKKRRRMELVVCCYFHFWNEIPCEHMCAARIWFKVILRDMETKYTHGAPFMVKLVNAHMQRVRVKSSMQTLKFIVFNHFKCELSNLLQWLCQPVLNDDIDVAKMNIIRLLRIRT